MFSFIASGSHIVIIPLNDGSCVYMFSFYRSDSDIVIIPLTHGSCVYMFSFKEVVLILLSFLSLMAAVYICSLPQEWFSYCYHSSH